MTRTVSLTTGQLARQGGVGVETIRFYERRGLIERPPRRPSGYRQFPEQTVQRLRFIRRAKELGFSLKEIKELLSLRLDPDVTCGDVRDRAKLKIESIDRKIATLRKMKSALAKLTAACDGRGSVGQCPIMEGLDHEE